MSRVYFKVLIERSVWKVCKLSCQIFNVLRNFEVSHPLYRVTAYNGCGTKQDGINLPVTSVPKSHKTVCPMQ